MLGVKGTLRAGHDAGPWEEVPVEQVTWTSGWSLQLDLQDRLTLQGHWLIDKLSIEACIFPCAK